jgi:hypothetical protein
MSDLNTMIDVARQFQPTQQQASIAQDGVNKANFALDLIKRMPQEPPKPEEPPRIPNLGALAVPN